MSSRFGQWYERIVLRGPVATIAVITLLVAALGWFTQDFALDASADSLTLENDEDLQFYRYVRARYGADDFLIVTYTPDGPMFEEATLDDLRQLRDELRALADVSSVTTILDVPLIMSPPVDLEDIAQGVNYLDDPATDRTLARAELLSSPLYKDLLISDDGGTTALRVDLVTVPRYREIRARRDALREKQLTDALSDEEAAELDSVSSEFQALGDSVLALQENAIDAVREVLDRHRNGASIFLGGLPMIVADSINFIRSDLLVFGAAVFVFLVVILATAFHKRRWVILPLLTCSATCIAMVGLLGLLGWRVTVVSSNFLSLLLILCLALNLHIIVRYRENHENHPDANQLTLVGMTIRGIVMPCLYTAITTIVAFGSLLVSGVRPVIDFGWMMAIGIIVAFVLSFTLFPAILMLLEPGKAPSRNDLTNAITRFFGQLIKDFGRPTLVFFALLSLFGIAGTTRLTVENRFIDYYKESTEIYQGMALIDRRLGGTTPLDVIIDAPPEPETETVAESDDDDEFVDIYADDADAEAGITARSHWFNSRQLGAVDDMHKFLDRLPDTGKVLSIATLARMIGQIEPDLLQDNFGLSILFEKLPDDIRETLVSPYLSDDGDQLRFGIRVYESDPELHREELLSTIHRGLTENSGLDASQVRLSGMLVLYNNMLHSLFRSQILTLGAVFLAIMAMFLVLFRSLKVASIAILPNLMSATLVLGIMGWFGIPLDLMTITIAAITVGIGVDDTIHYVHRFRHEFQVDRDYWAAVFRCHRSIGRAIYYTSVTIMLGFSILALSRFVPTIYFGLLTSLAMLLALIANITLLPLLIVTFNMDGAPDSVRDTT